MVGQASVLSHCLSDRTLGTVAVRLVAPTGIPPGGRKARLRAWCQSTVRRLACTCSRGGRQSLTSWSMLTLAACTLMFIAASTSPR